MTTQAVIQSAPVALLLAPFRLTYNAVSFSIRSVVSIFNHTVVIPILLTLNIMVYTPFIRIPLISPLMWMLELGESGSFNDYQWIKQQVCLFLVNALHFLLVSVYIGVFVGVISGINLRLIRFFFGLFLSSPKPQTISPAKSKALHNTPYVDAVYARALQKEQKTARASAGAVDTQESSPVSPAASANTGSSTTPLEPISPPYSPRDEASSTGVNSSQLNSQRLRARLRNKDHFVNDGLDLYEDDDGYGFNGVPTDMAARPSINTIEEETESEDREPASVNRETFSFRGSGAETASTNTAPSGNQK